MVQDLDPNMTWPCPRCKVPQVVTAMYCQSCGMPLGAAPEVGSAPIVDPPAEVKSAFSLRYPAVALAGVLVIVGAFLPWASLSTGLGSFSKAGIDGDGVFTLIGGIILVFLALTAAKRTVQVLGVLVCAAALFIVIHDGMAIADVSKSAVGTGLFATGIGGLIGAIASIEGR